MNEKCKYNNKEKCLRYSHHYCYGCHFFTIEFAKLFADGMESKSIIPDNIYTIKYKRKKYSGTILEIYNKWYSEQ